MDGAMLIGTLTFFFGKLLLMAIFVLAWWSIFMTSGDPWDVLGGLIIAAVWGLAIYLGIKKGQRQAREAGLIK